MTKPLTLEDINEKVRSKIYVQQYPQEKPIEGVRLIGLENMVDEEGEFLEILRLNEKGEVIDLSGFHIAQINRSTLYPQAVKAWHLHFKQDELWYVVFTDHLLVGLWDVRRGSATCGQVRRFILGGGRSQLLYIPKGIAHGSANIIDRPVTMWYFTNQHFNPANPDERRINWDVQGDKFWSPSRD